MDNINIQNAQRGGHEISSERGEKRQKERGEKEREREKSLLSRTSEEERGRGSVGKGVQSVRAGRTLNSSGADVGGKRQTDGQGLFRHGGMLRLSDS